MSNMSIYKHFGVGGELEVFEDKLTITPKGALGFMAKGLKGTKTIPRASITGIQHKTAGALTNGYLQFTVPGGIESRRGLFAAVGDENTIMFRESENAIVEKIKAFVEQKFQESRAPRPSPISVADELLKLVKLREQGILSDEEFLRAKQNLLFEGK